MSHDRKRMVAAHQPTEGTFEKLGFRHEPHGPWRPGAEDDRVDGADVVGNDQHRPAAGHVRCVKEVEFGAENDTSEEPCKTSEKEIAQIDQCFGSRAITSSNT